MRTTLYFAFGIFGVLLGGISVGFAIAFHWWLGSEINLISSIINEYGHLIRPALYQDLMDYYQWIIGGINLAWALAVIGIVFCGFGIFSIYRGIKAKS